MLIAILIACTLIAVMTYINIFFPLTFYPEALTLKILMWILTAAVTFSGAILFLFIWKDRNGKLDYPPNPDTRKARSVDRVIARNNAIRIIISILFIVGTILSQWVVDLPLGPVFYWWGTGFCLLYEIGIRIVNKTL